MSLRGPAGAELFEEQFRFPGGVGDGTAEDFVGDMEAERPIRFKLRLVEKLIGSRFMRKLIVTAGILGHIGRLVSRQRRL